MKHGSQKRGCVLLVALIALVGVQGVGYAQEAEEKASSYAPVDIKETFATIMARMKAAKATVMLRQMDLLSQRYDLSDRPAQGVTFPLRGIKDSPTYLHDGRLLTLEDTVEFFNLVLRPTLASRTVPMNVSKDR